MPFQALRMRQGGGSVPPVGGFPQIASVTNTLMPSSQTNHNVLLPAAVSAGDLLVISFGLSNTATITTPAGWTSLMQVADGGFGRRSAVFYKVAAGTEGGTSVNFVFSIAAGINAISVRITGAAIISMIEESHSLIANTYTGVPADLTPSWGSLETLWIVIGSNRRANPVNSYPFASNQHDYTSTATPPGGICICSTESEVSTIDPASLVYTNVSGHSGEYGVIFTLGIKPA